MPDKVGLPAMFLSMPEFQFKVPEALSTPGATFSRAMGLATNAAWYVVCVRPRDPERHRESFVVAWDSDVAHIIETMEADLESLMFVAPGRAGWSAKQIVEVWRATNPADESNPAILMIAEDGVEHSGYFMERVEGFQRGCLVGRVDRSRRSAGVQ